MKVVGRRKSRKNRRQAEISKNLRKTSIFFRNFSKKTWEGPLKVVGRRKSRKVVGRWRSQKDVSRKMKIGRRPPEGTGNHVGKRKTRQDVGRLKTRKDVDFFAIFLKIRLEVLCRISVVGNLEKTLVGRSFVKTLAESFEIANYLICDAPYSTGRRR